MEPNETTLISGRILAEFEDDASQFQSGEAEFVGAAETTAVIPATPVIPQSNDVVLVKPS